MDSCCLIPSIHQNERTLIPLRSWSLNTRSGCWTNMVHCSKAHIHFIRQEPSIIKVQQPQCPIFDYSNGFSTYKPPLIAMLSATTAKRGTRFVPLPNPCSIHSHILGKKVKNRGEVCTFLRITPLTIISIKTSRWELSNDKVIDKNIFKNNQITLFSSFSYLH